MAASLLLAILPWLAAGMRPEKAHMGGRTNVRTSRLEHLGHSSGAWGNVSGHHNLLVGLGPHIGSAARVANVSEQSSLSASQGPPAARPAVSVWGYPASNASRSAALGQGNLLAGTEPLTVGDADCDSSRRRAMPICILGFSVAAALALFGWHVRSSVVEQKARSVYLWFRFAIALGYTVVILDSYSLYMALGKSQAESGEMVGLYMLGCCIGVFTGFCALQRLPELWRAQPVRTALLGCSLQLLGAIMYMYVVCKIMDSTSLLSPEDARGHVEQARALSRILLASRFVGGLGSGVCLQLFGTTLMHLTPVRERPLHTRRWVLSAVLGIGAGPLLAGMLQSGRLCGLVPDFTLTGTAQLLLTGGSLAALLLYHPSLAEVVDKMPKHDITSSSTPERELQLRRKVVVGCLVMTFFRAYGIASIEVVTASVLEDEYHWDRNTIGMTVGLMFLSCVPMRSLYEAMQDLLPAKVWIRLLSLIAISATCLLFIPACGSLLQLLPIQGKQCSHVLVLAGVLLFPTLFMGDAISVGFMNQQVLPNGTRFDGNHSQLCYNLVTDLARFVGPWLSRLAVDRGGQDFFAAQQMIVASLFLMVAEIVVLPHMGAPRTSKG